MEERNKDRTRGNEERKNEEKEIRAEGGTDGGNRRKELER
jgi:hypothetical protein